MYNKLANVPPPFVAVTFESGWSKKRNFEKEEKLFLGPDVVPE